MRPRRRKCCPTWGLTLEASWPRSERGAHVILQQGSYSRSSGVSRAGGAKTRQKTNRKRNQEDDSDRETQTTGY